MAANDRFHLHCIELLKYWQVVILNCSPNSNNVNIIWQMDGFILSMVMICLSKLAVLTSYTTDKYILALNYMVQISIHAWFVYLYAMYNSSNLFRLIEQFTLQ